MFITALLVLLPILILWSYASQQKRLKLTANIPGPPVYPIIGNTFVWGRQDIDEAINHMLGFFKTYGQTVRIFVLHQMVFFTVEPKLLEVLLTSPRYIRKHTLYEFLREWLGNGLLISNGKRWFRRRKIITPTFHFKILEEFMEIFDEQSAILVEHLREHCGKGAININPYITLSALDIIAETALGTKIHAQTNPDCEYARAVYTMSDIVTARIVKPQIRSEWGFRIFARKLKKQQDEAIKVLHEFTGKIIEERRLSLLQSHPNDEDFRRCVTSFLIKSISILEIFGVYETLQSHTAQDDIGRKRKMALLDVLLQSTADGKPLSNNDIREEVDTFTFEGHDTTTAGISFTLYCLSRHPDAQNKVFTEIKEVIGSDKSKPVGIQELNDLKYLELVIKETMRLYPPVPIIGRKLEEDLQVGNKRLLAGSDITIPIFHLLKNPEVFPNPEKFFPERFLDGDYSEKSNPYAYIPFSAGPRNCIGQKFAMLEMKSTVSKVLRHFELLPMGESPKIVVNLVTRSTNGVNMGISERSNY